ncbi:MAG: dTDP-4-dehydrorhamnose reductase [Fusobacteriaceae bacterium]
MILITGAKGQLGYDFQRLFDSLGIEYLATDYDTLDITDIDAVRNYIEKNIQNLELIINCAAYNNVDKAEIEPELCYKLNAYAPRNLALLAKEYGADYITYSTDFVFDGEKTTPYTELDTPKPLSVYSKAKAEGERLTLEAYERSYVVRTSWVFGVANNNFNKQVIGWAANRSQLSIVDDQVSAPTYSKDLAHYSWELIKTKKYGLYHLANNGVASKYDQAKYILSKTGWTGELKMGKTSDFPLPAKRAPYSKLDSSKLEAVIGVKIPTWQDAIDRYLEDSYEQI